MGHSSRVEMELRLPGRIIPVAQLGPNFIIIRDSIEHPPATGEMMLSIDGKVQTWPVTLPDGISPTKSHTRIA